MKSAKFKIFVWGLVINLLLPLSTAGQVGFDPSNLLSDERFADTATLGGAAGIQKFLESQGSVLADTSAEFLQKLREPGDSGLKSRLPDPRPNLGRLRTAAELIYDAATNAGLNPQVVLVTLQKEQSLVTGKFASGSSLQRALDHSLGYGCPDEGGCSDIFYGFYFQLFGNFDAQDNRYIGAPAALIRSFSYESGGVRIGRGPVVDAAGNAFGNGTRTRTSRRGDTITLENTQGPPHNAPATQTVTLTNFATTALYRYTPHVYNGNYNFFKFFTAWFKYANGTLIVVAGDTKIYVIDEGLKRPISAFVITQRGLSAASVITVSPSELSEFTLGDVMPPRDGTVLKNAAGTAYLIEAGARKSLSSFVAAQRNLDLAVAAVVGDEELLSYKDGGAALPQEGTLVKSRDNAAVYVINNNEKRILSAFVFKQRGYSFKNVLTAEPGELDSYPTGKVMPPADGTLIKAKEEPAVYYVGNGKLQPMTLFVFQQMKFSFKNVVSVPKAELSAWEAGKPLPPPTGLLVKSKTSPAVYYIESGVRRPISYGVFLASRFSFKNVIVISDDELQTIELGEDMLLPDRALVKSNDAATVYYMIDGQLRPLTYTAFKNIGLRFEDVVTIPAEELAKYPIGAIVQN